MDMPCGDLTSTHFDYFPRIRAEYVCCLYWSNPLKGRYRRFIIQIRLEFVKELMKTKRKLGQENVIVRAELKKDRSIRIKKLAKKSGILGE